MEQMDIASHLGIGLIQIKDRKCHGFLSSPFYTPITRLNLELLEKLGLGRCQFCGSIFDVEKPGMVGKEAVTGNRLRGGPIHQATRLAGGV